MPPFEKGGHITLHTSVGMSVGLSVSLNFVQLITKEHFSPEASNLVGTQSFWVDYPYLYSGQ